MADSDDLQQQDAEELLRLAARGVRGAALGQPIARLEPTIRRLVLANCRSSRHWPSASQGCDDVVQAILERLITHPPTGEGHPAGAAVTLRAWIKTTTTRYCIDLHRRSRFLAADAGERMESYADPRSETGLREERGEACQWLSAFIGWLSEQQHDQYAAFLRLSLDHPDATGGELAAALGVSRDNLYKIRERVRALAVRFQQARASDREGRADVG